MPEKQSFNWGNMVVVSGLASLWCQSSGGLVCNHHHCVWSDISVYWRYFHAMWLFYIMNCGDFVSRWCSAIQVLMIKTFTYWWTKLGCISCSLHRVFIQVQNKQELNYCGRDFQRGNPDPMTFSSPAPDDYLAQSGGKCGIWYWLKRNFKEFVAKVDTLLTITEYLQL